MRNDPALARWMVVACALAAPTPVLHADSASPTPAGYQDKKIQGMDGKISIIRVQNPAAPHLGGPTPAPKDGKYDPENMDFTRASSFSNQTFNTAHSALSKNDTAAEALGDHQFQTKSFTALKPDSEMNLDRKYQTQSFASSSKDPGEFQKTFPTTGSTITQGKENPLGEKTSEFQNRTANLGGPSNAPFAGPSEFSDKTFFDPAMTHVKRDPYAAANNLDVSHMVDLPNRPLTIDEVRNLINHETVPDLNEKPDEPSKALNDPDYQPPLALPEAHGDLVTPGPEEKDSELPSPGEMAAPGTPAPAAK
jgi:hypothetical protein